MVMRKRIKKWNEEYKEGRLNITRVSQSWNSWLGHISHANTYHLMETYKDKMKFMKNIMEEK